MALFQRTIFFRQFFGEAARLSHAFDRDLQLETMVRTIKNEI